MRAGKDTWTGCSAGLWHGAGSVPLAKSHCQSSGSGSAEWHLMAQHTCSLEPGSLSMHPPPCNWPVLFVQLGEPHRVVTAVS